MALCDFAMPPVCSHGDGWGPPPGETLNNGICDFVEHLDKFPLSRVGRTCDFTASGVRYAEQRAGKGKGKMGFGKGKGGNTVVTAKDEEGFSLVDNRPLPGKSAGRGKSFGRGKGRGKGIQANYQEGILGQKQKPFFNTSPQKGKAKGKGGNQRRGLPSYKEWSVQTKTEWTVMREIMLGKLAQLQIDARQVELDDIMWCGKLHQYNREFDRITAKTERPMRRFEDLSFFNVSTSDDPHLPELLQNDPTVTVIATDHVLACLIAAARSVYSWDIVVSKVQGKLIFDKRDGSQIDFLSVNETAQEPPNNDDINHMNSPLKLGQEASCINQNFSQMALNTRDEPEMCAQGNPFEDEDEPGTVASGAYRYRKITIPGNAKAESEFEQNPVSIIARCEVNSKAENGGLLSLKALNEFDPKLAYSWKTHLETQRGAVLATELKNNAFKLGRWTAQAILGGCDTMKIGYISRTHPTDPWSHTVLGVQTHHTDGFADQIGLTRNNMYGILRNIIDEVMRYEDGKYLLLKDPTKSVMRIYELPWDTFGEEDEEDEEEEEEMHELDEDGQPVPKPQAPLGGGKGQGGK